jgi:hypothetical protein
LDEEKSKQLVWLSIDISSISAQFAEAGKRHSKAYHYQRRVNKYNLTAAPCF